MSSGVLAAGGDGSRFALSRDERLHALFAPIRNITKTTAIIVAGSALVHAALVATAVVSSRAPLAPPKEIAVEIVQEIPQPKPEPAKAPEPPKPAPMAKSPDMPKPAPVKAPSPAKPVPPPPRLSAEEAALQKEIENLRSEQAALKQQLATSAAQRADKTQEASGKAVAMANASAEGGDVVGYQQLVFSQLARAKDGDGFKGAVGTTGVRFEIAGDGSLARVEVAMSSGDAALDRQALAIVRRAAPFPPPPKDAERIVFANVNFVAPKHP